MYGHVYVRDGNTEMKLFRFLFSIAEIIIF